MKVSAFIRSYMGDMGWLEYCLRSLKLRGGQFNEIVVVVPMSAYSTLLALIHKVGITVRAFHVRDDLGNSYIVQQFDKMNADQFCTGDFIAHADSDCVATEEINIEDFFVAGRPKLLFRRWDDVGGAIMWKAPTQSALGVEPRFETMATHPGIYHRSSHELLRRHIEQVHGKSFADYMASVSKFSEFNAIGNFCHQFTPDAYHFVRAGANDGYPRPLKQFWSHGPIDHAEMERLLK